MRRIACTPRDSWVSIVKDQGLTYAEGYWDESAYYEFSLAEIEALEEDVASLHQMCLDTVAWVISNRRYNDYGITDPRVVQLIEQSWSLRDKDLYGRFDLCYDGTGRAKMLEYNADTPTALLEAAAVQWFWLRPGVDQWNSIHEKLIEAWRDVPGPVHFAYTAMDESGEDFMTVSYMQECAAQAGLVTISMPIEDIGWDPAGRFVDGSSFEIKTIFKLYPWEWLVADKFGGNLIDLALSGRGPKWIEPAWKMLLSNKALLALLWERYPGHPNLLPSYLDSPRELAGTGYVEKPILGREGAGIRIVPSGQSDSEGVCFQAFYPLPYFDGQRPVLGAWIVNGEPAGLGIRETPGLITDTTAHFVPHQIA